MSAIVIIPARYASTRFPGKPLAPLKGLPIIQHVYRNAKRSRRAGDVLVATDSREIFDTVVSFGGKAVMTSGDHESGTDRIAEAARTLDQDVIVNVQGDEPLIQPDMIDSAIETLDDPRASIGTLAIRIKNQREIFDPNTVKVVYNEEGFALYFSRAPIPYYRDEFGTMQVCAEKNILTGADPGFITSELRMFKHVGIYSYRRDVLMQLSGLPPSALEKIEKLEQLRALENGFTIKVRETENETFGVDTPEDLERIEKCLSSSL